MTQNEVERRTTKATDHTAVGIIAREDRIDAVVRTALRANRFGYPVMVTCADGSLPEISEFTDQLDIEIVDPLEPVTDEENLRRLLAMAARARSFDGLIVQSGDYDWIDFESSEAHIDEDTFVVDAVSDAQSGLPTSISVLVGIPAYNETRTIADVVAQANEQADHVLVVDDGSTDDTVERAEAAGAEVLQHKTNNGYGAALRTIFEEAHRRDVEHLVVLDADAQHDPADIKKLVHEREQTGADMVIGSRFVGRSGTKLPLYRRLGLSLINVMTNVSMTNVTPSSWVRDTQSGFRAYGNRAIATLAESDYIGSDMDASTDILYTASQEGWKIQEVETTIRYDVDDANSYNPVVHGLILVSNLLRSVEREHPILLLGVPGFLSLSVGFLFSYLVVLNFIQTGAFPLGTATAASFFVIVGLFTCFTSIILHSLNVHLKNDVA